MRQAGVDERATKRKVHIHQDAVLVDPAGVRRRLLSLLRGDLRCCLEFETEEAERRPHRSAEVSSGQSSSKKPAAG